MRDTSQHSISKSFWQLATPVESTFEPLQEEHSCDVLVVGAGITGLTTAIELAEAGFQVTICEAESIGTGNTAMSTGHLDAWPEEGGKAAISRHGLTAMQSITRLRTSAIDRIEKLAGSDCDFQRVSGIYYSEDAEDLERFKEELNAAHSLGLAAEQLGQVPISKGAVGIRISPSARIDTAKYLLRLVEVARDLGVQIFERTFVESASQDEQHEFSTASGTIHCQNAVFAVHCNFVDSLALYAAVPPYQSYAIVAEIDEVLEDTLFWDNSDPYFYVRRISSETPQLIMAGGCDHRTGMNSAREATDQLLSWVTQRFHMRKIVSQWSGEFFEPADGLPMIGKAPGAKNIWIVTGLSGIGLTWGTAAAGLIRMEMMGESSDIEKLISPSRLGMSQPGTWIREQTKTAMNYSERIVPASEIDVAHIHASEGQTGKIDGEFVAFCRDDAGCPHRLDPICPHMGGVLQWNDLEQTWDCPVHGGRFTASGERIYGPPQSNMKRQ